MSEVQRGTFPLSLLDPAGTPANAKPKPTPAATAAPRPGILSTIASSTGEAVHEQKQAMFEGLREKIFGAGMIGNILRKTWEKRTGTGDEKVSDMATQTFGAVQAVAKNTQEANVTLVRIERIATNISENIIAIATTLKAESRSLQQTLERMNAQREEDSAEAMKPEPLSTVTGTAPEKHTTNPLSNVFDNTLSNIKELKSALETLPLLVKAGLVAGAGVIGYAIGTQLSKLIDAGIEKGTGGAKNGGEDTLGGVLARLREKLTGDDERIRQGKGAGEDLTPPVTNQPKTKKQLAIRNSFGGEKFHAENDVAADIDPLSAPVPSATQPAPASQAGVKDRMTGTDANEDDALMNVIRSEEGFRANPYLDPPGNSKSRYAIGYGHVITPEEKKDGLDVGGRKVPFSTEMKITKAEALALLKRDLPRYVEIVKKGIGAKNYDKLAVEQKAALVSYAYNTGTTPTDLKNQLDAGDFKGAAQSISDGINTSDKKFNKGLAARRKREGDMFATASSGTQIAQASTGLAAARDQRAAAPTVVSSAPANDDGGGNSRRRGIPSPIANRGSAEAATRVG